MPRKFLKPKLNPKRCGANQHLPDFITARMALIAKLHLKRMNQRQITKWIAENEPEFSVTYQQVSSDLQNIRREWQESKLFDFNEAKRQELEQLYLMREEAWTAYHRTIGSLYFSAQGNAHA